MESTDKDKRKDKVEERRGNQRWMKIKERRECGENDWFKEEIRKEKLEGSKRGNEGKRERTIMVCKEKGKEETRKKEEEDKGKKRWRG